MKKHLVIHESLMDNSDLTPAEKMAGALLTTKEVWTVKEIADALQVSRVTVYRLLNALKDKGVVSASTEEPERGTAYTVKDLNGARIVAPLVRDPNRHLFKGTTS